jgi:hypothetical protein
MNDGAGLCASEVVLLDMKSGDIVRGNADERPGDESRLRRPDGATNVQGQHHYWTVPLPTAWYAL